MLGRDGKVRVMDFGLARHDKPRGDDATPGPSNAGTPASDATAIPLVALAWNVAEPTDVDATRIVPPPDESPASPV